jgi:hypothetical protein
LQAESAEITKNLFACKEAQSTMLKEIDMLKQERKPLVEKKVSPVLMPGITTISHASLGSLDR